MGLMFNPTAPHPVATQIKVRTKDRWVETPCVPVETTWADQYALILHEKVTVMLPANFPETKVEAVFLDPDGKEVVTLDIFGSSRGGGSVVVQPVAMEPPHEPR